MDGNISKKPALPLRMEKINAGFWFADTRHDEHKSLAFLIHVNGIVTVVPIGGEPKRPVEDRIPSKICEHWNAARARSVMMELKKAVVLLYRVGSWCGF
ncbi:hypothetical protein [Paenibacillus sp. DMB20]|uniref:hypothetical protein n=1 Tax=Paenibacillus sp. DMB20 TaxID=1642570 RepID=UPI0006280AE2|nr:hypothetical protein [Paenibacillus sp. DMB20]KKO50829.1 hypothetical protein XI25_29845 [Paenibacillus sp. DMB20]